MLTREELIHLFDRFSDLISQPDVKKRIADAVNDNQEAVAVTTAIQGNTYGDGSREEMACEEAELGPDEYSKRLQMQKNLHQQQLEMLKHMRNYGVEDQSAILEKLRQQMEKEEFESETSLLSVEEIQNIVQNGA